MIIYSLNLICSYAIFIYPCNQIIEDYLFRGIKKSKKTDSLIYILTNISRLFVVVSATYVAIELSKKLDLFLSILGALLCAPLAITLPAFLHLKVLAKTPREIMIDIFLIILSIFCLIISTQ